jgi:hypothetical protein
MSLLLLDADLAMEDAVEATVAVGVVDGRFGCSRGKRKRLKKELSQHNVIVVDHGRSLLYFPGEK